MNAPLSRIRALSIRFAGLCLSVGLLAAVPIKSETFAETSASASNEAAAAAVFDEASRLVRFNFYDPKFKGKDWDAISAQYRGRYLASKTRKDRSKIINDMLGELDASHMIHATPDEPAYYQLADIFSFAIRRDKDKHFPNGISYPGIGVFTRDADGKTFISGVLAGLPGAKAGLVVGDEIVNVDGAPFEPVGSFRDKVGGSVAITIRRERNGPESVITVRPERIEPGKAFQTAMRDSARIIESNGKKLGYIRVWSYAGQDYQNILAEELAEGKLKDADALIWDLRDGWGGAHPRYLDLFNPNAPDMTFTDRQGTTSYASFKWRKPVALVINGGTRSGKEVLTYGFKKYGRGQVIGTTTAGALLAGRGYLLSDGSFLMVAVNDVAVDGERLEGKGVAPTIEVPIELPYAAGRDPQLDKAIEVLSAEQRG